MIISQFEKSDRFFPQNFTPRIRSDRVRLFSSTGQKSLLAPSHCLHVRHNASSQVPVLNGQSEARAADNTALLPKCYHGLRMQSDIILENSYRRDRNATRNLKDFARFYDTMPHKKSSTVFPADFAASSVERKFGSFRAQDKNPFLPHLTACMYATMQVHKFPF